MNGVVLDKVISLIGAENLKAAFFRFFCALMAVYITFWMYAEFMGYIAIQPWPRWFSSTYVIFATDVVVGIVSGSFVGAILAVIFKRESLRVIIVSVVLLLFLGLMPLIECIGSKVPFSLFLHLFVAMLVFPVAGLFLGNTCVDRFRHVGKTFMR